MQPLRTVPASDPGPLSAAGVLQNTCSTSHRSGLHSVVRHLAGLTLQWLYHWTSQYGGHMPGRPHESTMGTGVGVWPIYGSRLYRPGLLRPGALRPCDIEYIAPEAEQCLVRIRLEHVHGQAVWDVELALNGLLRSSLHNENEQQQHL